MLWRWLVLASVAVVLAACASVSPAENPSPSPPQAMASPTAPQAGPQVSTPVRAGTGQPPLTVTPQPSPVGTPREMPAPGIPPKVRRRPLPFPQPGDEALLRSPVYLSALHVEAATGGKVLLRLKGSLPTPCHALRLAVTRLPGRIEVQAYSVVSPTQECAQVLQPFAQEVKLGPFPDGDYEVFVNGTAVGKVRVAH